MWRLCEKIWKDTQEVAQMQYGNKKPLSLLKILATSDSLSITTIQHLRMFARRYHLLGVNHFLRIYQTTICGIELGKDIKLGEGVWFIHSLGIVIGGNSVVGDRVRFFGNNTIGTAKENGCPIIGNDVWVGAGARILGPIRIGNRAVIGANAVVLQDVPDDAVAVGVPAKIIVKSLKTKDKR